MFYRPSFVPCFNRERVLPRPGLRSEQCKSAGGPMHYRITARVKNGGSDGFEVLTPDLQSAIEVAKGLRLRHQNMRVEITTHRVRVSAFSGC